MERSAPGSAALKGSCGEESGGKDTATALERSWRKGQREQVLPTGTPPDPGLILPLLEVLLGT